MVEVPVSPYLGTDIWQGKGLDGLWFNILRLIYLPRLSVAIHGGTPLKERCVVGQFSAADQSNTYCIY
jgi:hypothetical protein